MITVAHLHGLKTVVDITQKSRHLKKILDLSFAECFCVSTRQIAYYRVPDRIHSAKNLALDKPTISGSDISTAAEEGGGLIKTKNKLASIKEIRCMHIF